MMRTEQKQAATLEQAMELLKEVAGKQDELGKRFDKIEERLERLEERFDKLESRTLQDSKALSDIIGEVHRTGRKLDALHTIVVRRANELLDGYQRNTPHPCDDDETDPAIRLPVHDTIPAGPSGEE